jgi:hypothetical protein
MGRIIVQVIKVIFKLFKRKPPLISKKVKVKFPKSKSSCIEKCPTKTTSNPYKKLPRDKVLDSKKAYEKLIAEHEKKLADYRANPYKYDNLGTLKNASPELQQKIIDGRIRALEKQLIKQQNELKKIEEVLNTSAP